MRTAPRGANIETGAFGASLLVGIIVAPVAERIRTPFAAFGASSLVVVIKGGPANAVGPGAEVAPENWTVG